MANISLSPHCHKQRGADTDIRSALALIILADVGHHIQPFPLRTPTPYC